jgi:hypothetical protein
MKLTNRHTAASSALLATVLLGLTAWNGDSGQEERDASAAPAHFNAEGELVRPEGYREWVFVGTPLTPNDMNNGNAPFPEFHNVYIDPGSWEHYERTGEFREGTTFVKELVSVGSKVATSGAGYFMGEFIGLEVAIKSEQRFPDEPGHWAYYSFGHAYPLADTAKAFPAQACNACHQNAAADDFVFTQYYPVLRAGKGPLQGEAREASSAKGTTHDGESCEECKRGLERFEETKERAGEPSAETDGGTAVTIPLGKEELFAFLVDGSYRSFPAKESDLHPSNGPHSIEGEFGKPVRAYLNATVLASLEAGNDEHPAGSAIVKEMYGDEGELQGWAVSVKTQSDADGGKGWFWYEVTSTEDPDALVANGNGVASCYGCHSVGRDFVLTTFPLQ